MEKNKVGPKYRRRSTEWKAKYDILPDVSRHVSCGNFEINSKSPCNPESLDSIANALVDSQKQAVLNEKSIDSVDQKEDNIFHCALCNSLYVEPVTLDCGHTLCKSCILPDTASTQVVDCKLCGRVTNHDNEIAVNVLMTDLIQKRFPREYEEEVKKLEKVRRELRGDKEKVVETLSGVLRNNPHHITALKWRSHALLKLGLYKQALEDAELACDLRPFLPSVFHQRGEVLFAMGKYEKAIQSLARALALGPNNGAGYRLKLLSYLNRFLTSDIDSPRKKVLLLKRIKSFGSTECNTYRWFPKFKALSDQDDENSHSEVLNELQNGRNLEETVGNPIEASLENRPSLKRSCETEDVEHSARSKCLKVSRESETSCGGFISEATVMSDKEDLECKICYDVLYHPVTTVCGHSFCRDCLLRALDYKAECPCCRRTLNCEVQRNTEITRVVKEIVQNLCPEEYAERKISFSVEEARWKGAGVNDNVEVPIFVCLLAFPSLRYPLHIFEPKYRLMIRQCVELGSRMFGMCANTDEPNKSYADYGTMLHIDNINVLPDGRSIIHTTAGRRFRVVSRSTRNGYNTAKIEWMDDECPNSSTELQDLEMLNADCYKVLKLWFSSLTPLQQTCISNAIGPIPSLDRENLSSRDGPSWLWWALAAVPLQDKAKLIILSMTSLAERLQSVRRFLELLLKVKYHVTE